MAVCSASIDKGHFLYTVSRNKYELLHYQSKKLCGLNGHKLNLWKHFHLFNFMIHPYLSWSFKFSLYIKFSLVLNFFTFLWLHLILIIFSSFVVAWFNGYQYQWLLIACLAASLFVVCHCLHFAFFKTTNLIFHNPYLLLKDCSAALQCPLFCCDIIFSSISSNCLASLELLKNTVRAPTHQKCPH